MSNSDPIRLAEAWVAVDPDPQTRAEIEQILQGGTESVHSLFHGRLGFGTAGIRGQLGAGPNRMNRVLVRVVATAIGAQLDGETDSHVVVGFDARHKSRDFAEDTVRVLAALGVRCTLLSRPFPTPVLAHAVRHLAASAGVMVTASHNPRTDNGYKVYWRGGLQITAPVDAEISRRIGQIPLVHDADLVPIDHELISVADDTVVDDYVDAVVNLLGQRTGRTARCAYTPLHGVGSEVFARAFLRAGFPAPAVVASQDVPDPDFPTTPFPNPEEPGVIDQLVKLAAEIGADVAMANDPDADRLAVAVPNGARWRLLTGDELGCLLAEHLLGRRATDNTRMVVNTVVSSQLLARIAAHHNAEHLVTLTGFKWIMQARIKRDDLEFVMGYEEALGYAIGDAVWDKDGVSAALVIAELVSEATASGRTVLDLLDDIHRRHGVFVSGQRSIRFETSGSEEPMMAVAMAALRRRPPTELAAIPVRRVLDLARGDGDLGRTDAVVLELDGCRVIVRPSGTEPKMKIYGEVEIPVGSDLDGARLKARTRLNRLLDDAIAVVAAPEEAEFAGVGSGSDGPGDRVPLPPGELPDGDRRATDLRMIVRCMDLIAYEGDAAPGRVRAICAQARRPDPADPTVGPAAAVCVHPSMAGLASELLAGTTVRVATETGDVDLRVCLDIGELGSIAAVRSAAELVIDEGAETLEVSTRTISTAMSLESMEAIAECVGHHFDRTGLKVAIKVSGDVDTADEAIGHLNVVRTVLGDHWLTPDRLRFGSSSLLADVLSDLVATELSLRAQ